MKDKFSKFISSYQGKLALSILILIALLSFASPYFFTIGNAKDILLGAAVTGIISIGMTLVIINGGIDLSVGSTVALSATILALLLKLGFSVPIALLLTLLAGFGAGALNGLFIAYAGINPFIITLGTMSLYRGLAFIIGGGYPITVVNAGVRFIGSGQILGIPVPIYLIAIVFIILYVVLKYTEFGRNIYAIGDNELTAVFSGIEVKKTKFMIYGINGLLAAISGFILTAQIYAGDPSAGRGYELDAIAAVILGGASLSGGTGTLFGTFLGIATVSIIINGQNLLNVPYFYQLLSKGIVILIAMLVTHKKNE